VVSQPHGPIAFLPRLSLGAVESEGISQFLSEHLDPPSRNVRYQFATLDVNRRDLVQTLLEPLQLVFKFTIRLCLHGVLFLQGDRLRHWGLLPGLGAITLDFLQVLNQLLPAFIVLQILHDLFFFLDIRNLETLNQLSAEVPLVKFFPQLLVPQLVNQILLLSQDLLFLPFSLFLQVFLLLFFHLFF
jgi:hypothetical protein